MDNLNRHKLHDSKPRIDPRESATASSSGSKTLLLLWKMVAHHGTTRWRLQSPPIHLQLGIILQLPTSPPLRLKIVDTVLGRCLCSHIFRGIQHFVDMRRCLQRFNITKWHAFEQVDALYNLGVQFELGIHGKAGTCNQLMWDAVRCSEMQWGDGFGEGKGLLSPSSRERTPFCSEQLGAPGKRWRGREMADSCFWERPRHRSDESGNTFVPQISSVQLQRFSVVQRVLKGGKQFALSQPIFLRLSQDENDPKAAEWMCLAKNWPRQGLYNLQHVETSKIHCAHLWTESHWGSWLPCKSPKRLSTWAICTGHNSYCGWVSNFILRFATSCKLSHAFTHLIKLSSCWAHP